MASKTPVYFSLPQRVLHWTMALLIVFNLIFSDGMSHAWRLVRRGEAVTPDELLSANIHAWVGMTILALAVLRLCLRLVQGAPPAPGDEPPLLRIAAKVAHIAFYALFFALPLSGMAAWFFGVQPAGVVHGGPLKALMWALLIVHVAAALVHHFYWKTDVLRRMTRGQGA